METILDKKKIRVIFWFAFKMGHKAAETTRNINNAFGSGTDNKHPVQCRGGSRNFATETRALKLRSAVAGHQKLTTTNWEQSSNLILSYNYTRSCWGTQCQTFDGHSAFQAKWKDEKTISGCLTSWLKQNKITLKFYLFLFYAKIMNHFSIRLWLAMKSGFYMTTSDY